MPQKCPTIWIGCLHQSSQWLGDRGKSRGSRFDDDTYLLHAPKQCLSIVYDTQLHVYTRRDGERRERETVRGERERGGERETHLGNTITGEVLKFGLVWCAAQNWRGTHASLHHQCSTKIGLIDIWSWNSSVKSPQIFI